MALTKERLVAALKVAQDAQAQVDAAKAAEATAKEAQAVAETARDEYKVGHDIVNDAEVIGLVDAIIPPVEVGNEILENQSPTTVPQPPVNP